MVGIPKPTPKEFRNIPYYKKLDLLVKHYIITCTKEDLVGKNKAGKSVLCSAYWKIKRFWYNQTPDRLLYLYDYLYSLPEESYMDLHDFYRNAEIHRKAMLRKNEESKLAELKVERRDEINLKDVFNL